MAWACYSEVSGKKGINEEGVSSGYIGPHFYSSQRDEPCLFRLKPLTRDFRSSYVVYAVNKERGRTQFSTPMIWIDLWEGLSSAGEKKAIWTSPPPCTGHILKQHSSASPSVCRHQTQHQSLWLNVWVWWEPRAKQILLVGWVVASQPRAEPNLSLSCWAPAACQCSHAFPPPDCNKQLWCVFWQRYV